MRLDSDSPADLAERAGLVDALSDYQIGVLDNVESVQRSRNLAVDQAATAAAARERAESEAGSLLAGSTQQLAQARREVDALGQELAQQEALPAEARDAQFGAEGAEHARQQAQEL